MRISRRWDHPTQLAFTFEGLAAPLVRSQQTVQPCRRKRTDSSRMRVVVEQAEPQNPGALEHSAQASSRIPLNTTLDDIAAEIGFTATMTLVAWYGGTHLYVPEKVSEKHAIAKAVGLRLAQRLVAAHGGGMLFVPDAVSYDRTRRDRMVVEGVGRGMGTKQLAALTGLTERRVQQIRQRLEAEGVLPMVLNGRAVEANEGVMA